MKRKRFYSLNMQVVCEANARILDIIARWRGSAHDSRIWNNCNLKRKFEANEINGTLIGDNGYPSSLFMLVPVLRPASPAEERYNYAHMRTRNVIERLFGQWKNKFRCFFNGIHMSLETTKACIIALAVLHNIAANERLDDEEEYSDDSDTSDEEHDNMNVNDIAVRTGARNNGFRRAYIDNYFG